MQIFNHHQLLMSLDCHGNGADLIRCCNISRQPTSLGKMALTVRGALHTYIYMPNLSCQAPALYPQTNYVQQPSARAGQVLALQSGPWPKTLVKGSVPQSCRECKLTSYTMNPFAPPDQCSCLGTVDRGQKIKNMCVIQGLKIAFGSQHDLPLKHEWFDHVWS